MVLAFSGQAWCDWRDDAVSYAYEMLNYTWYTDGYILLHNGSSGPWASGSTLNFSSTPYVATGNVRGIPYTLSSNNTGGGSEKSFSDYKSLSASEKLEVSKIYSYDGNRIGMRYGMSCASFVTDCIAHGLTGRGLYRYPVTSIHRQSGWSSVVKQGAPDDAGYRALKKGDYLYHQNGNHVRLVVENNTSAGTITYIDQTPPDGTRTGCTNKQYLSSITLTAYDGSITYNGPAWKVCMECNACKNSTTGTHIATISYSSLPLYPAYYPMYVDHDGPYPHPDTSGINPGLLKANDGTRIYTYTLTSGKYNVYSDANLTTRGTTTVYNDSSAWTGESDEDYIIGVGKNSSGTVYAKISYPITGGRREAYVNLKEVFVPGTLKDEAKTAKHRHYGLYIRKNEGRNSSYGIDVGDSVYLLTEDNGWCQVLYPTSSGWRIAWLTKDNYEYVVGISVPTITSVPNDIVVAGQYYSKQCTAEGSVSSWSVTGRSVPSRESKYASSGLPSGLSMSSSGLLSGTIGHTSRGRSAFAWERYYFTVRAANSSGGIGFKEAGFDVYEPPEIRTESLPYGQLGQSYSQDITSYGTEYTMRWKIKRGTLPPGLTFNGPDSKRTATISGTPTRKGSYRFTVELSNVWGAPETTVTKDYVIRIGEEPPIDPLLNILYTFVKGKVGEWFSDWVRVSGRSSFNSYEVVRGSLPPGTYLEHEGMKIYLKGTPTTAGDYTFTLRVTGDYGYKDKSLTVTIDPNRPDPWPDPSMSISYTFVKGKLGVYFNDYVKIKGGTSPYTTTCVSGTLPPGLRIVQQGEYIWLRGYPTRTNTSGYKFTLRAMGEHKGYVEKEFKLVIGSNSSYERASATGTDGTPTKPKIATTKIPDAAVRSEYSLEFEAGGTEPITWSYTGNLPEGFTFTDSGALIGIPMEVGKYKFKVTATNSEGTATKAYTLKVKPQKPTISVQTFPNAVLNEPYSVKVEASGTEPIKWSKGGKFPKGLKLDKNTGEISGTPTKAGSYTFYVKAKNASGYDKVYFQIDVDEEEVEKTDNASVNLAALPAGESGNNLDLTIISGDAITSAGSPLVFRLGDEGDEIDPSEVEVLIDGAAAQGVEVRNDGTFTVPAELVNGEFSVSAKVGASDETDDVAVSATDSSGGCSAGLSGIMMLALCSFALRKNK